MWYLSKGFWRYFNGATFCYTSKIFIYRTMWYNWPSIFSFNDGCLRAKLCTQGHGSMFKSPDFTVIIKDDSLVGYMTLCSSVRNYTSCYNLLHSHPKGWFFAIFEKSSISINNDIEATSRTSNTSQQDSVGALLNISDNNNKICTAAKSSALALYAICFSVLKPCSYWNSDTLLAIVESALLNDSIEYWISSSELPQNINTHVASIAVNFVSNERGTLVCSSSSSELALERVILQ